MSDEPDERPVQPSASETPEAAEPVAEPPATGARARRRTTPRGAAALAVTASLAALCSGLAIVATLSSAEGATVGGEWYASIAFVTAAVFGPGTLAAALGGQALLRRRPWAPILLLFVGTIVAAMGLGIVALSVSQATAPDGAPSGQVALVFGDAATQALWVVALMGALHALSGVLEAGAGILGRQVARERSRGAG